MTNDEWTTRMTEAMRMIAVDSHAASAKLRLLLQDTRSATETSPGSWEVGQCISILAQLEAEDGNLEAAAQLDETLAEMGKTTALQWQYSSGLAYARAALHHFKLGDDNKAMSLAEKALAHVDAWSDPSIFYEELIRQVRRVQNDRSSHGA